jgi:type 1 glutamine amidotransferase
LSEPIELLIVTQGHPYDRSSFMAIFDADPGVNATAVEQPAAQVMLRPQNVEPYQAILFYDMSGVAPAEDPGTDYRTSIEALLERGTGIVLLNHALLSWPKWPVWRALSRTSFLLRAQAGVPGSGFVDRATTRLSAASRDHPVLAGLEDGFEITDELYLKTAGFESEVVPLLRSDYNFVQEEFSAPPLAPSEEQDRWQHPPGSNLVAWANSAGKSRVVASELGDGPSAYENPGFRKLVGNAVRWVARSR